MARSEGRPRGGSRARRQERGARTRGAIIETALRLAAIEGLAAMTMGGVAAEAGLSKAGLYAHFSSKEALQLAILDAAYERFAAEVVGPALASPPGVARLRCLLEGYAVYIQERRDQGGCFFTALALEYDSRPGPVLDRLLAIHAARGALLEGLLEEARGLGELKASADVPQLAFEAIALTLGANVEYTLSRDPAVFDRWRAALGRRLEQAGA